MLVDVTLMRFGGQKLSPEELRAAAPVRGILTVTTSTITRIGDKGASPRNAHQTPHERTAPTSVEGSAHQQVEGQPVRDARPRDNRPKIGRSTTQPHAWWCRLAEDSDTVLMLNRDPTAFVYDKGPPPNLLFRNAETLTMYRRLFAVLSTICTKEQARKERFVQDHTSSMENLRALIRN